MTSPRDDERSIPNQPTTESLRALAHPMRLKILGHLRRAGPATASTLAREFGLNSGATSYHLRQLAAHGFIHEDPTLGNARQRWWRASQPSTYFDRETLSGEGGESLLRSVSQIHAERTQNAIDQRVAMPQEWQDAVNLSDWLLRLTPSETRELNRELAEVMRRYRNYDSPTPPADAIEVSVQYQVLPQASPDPIDER